MKGKRHGKGKEYDINSNLIFEGEYLYGEKHGIGKEYINGELIYEGLYFFGKKKNEKNDDLEFIKDKFEKNRETLNDEIIAKCECIIL